MTKSNEEKSRKQVEKYFSKKYAKKKVKLIKSKSVLKFGDKEIKHTRIEIDVEDPVYQELLKDIADIPGARILAPGRIVTMEFLSHRFNVVISNSGKIDDFRWG